MQRKIILFAAQVGTVVSALSALLLFAAFIESSLSFIGFIMLMPLACVSCFYLFRISIMGFHRIPVRKKAKTVPAKAGTYSFASKKERAA
ncbi:MAG: hypothetical protein ACK5JF_09310 [Oscillospiraceae bacterium]